MINGLGVLGWGVGGIEAEAVMLAQPISMVRIFIFILESLFSDRNSGNYWEILNWRFLT
jgi:hypothetical protein